jgi:hypothetical protein
VRSPVGASSAARLRPEEAHQAEIDRLLELLLALAPAAVRGRD